MRVISFRVWTNYRKFQNFPNSSQKRVYIFVRICYNIYMNMWETGASDETKKCKIQEKNLQSDFWDRSEPAFVGGGDFVCCFSA